MLLYFSWEIIKFQEMDGILILNPNLDIFTGNTVSFWG